MDSSSLDSDSGDSGSNLGSSDSSDLSDSDDSDDLENWMILGRGNQDGDQSISLNLEGKFDSNAGEFFPLSLFCLCMYNVQNENNDYFLQPLSFATLDSPAVLR